MVSLHYNKGSVKFLYLSQFDNPFKVLFLILKHALKCCDKLFISTKHDNHGLLSFVFTGEWWQESYMNKRNLKVQQFHNNLWILSLFYTVTKTEVAYKIIYNELMRQKRCCMLVSNCSSKGITDTVSRVRWTLDQWKIEYISFQHWRCVTLTKISINVFCINCLQMSSKYMLRFLAMNFECLLFLTHWYM
jgi:hypothetical protein